MVVPDFRTIGQSGLVGRDAALPSVLPYGGPRAVELSGEGAVRHGAQEMGVGVPVYAGRDAEATIFGWGRSTLRAQFTHRAKRIRPASPTYQVELSGPCHRTQASRPCLRQARLVGYGVSGADPNTVNNKGKTPLHEASYDGREPIVYMLLAKGAKVNVKDEKGCTPLHDTVYYDKDVVVQLLIKAGADVAAKNGEGFTPLEVAEKRKRQKSVAILKKHGGK